MRDRLKRRGLMVLAIGVAIFAPRDDGIGFPARWSWFRTHGYTSWRLVDPRLFVSYIVHGDPRTTASEPILDLVCWKEITVMIDFNRSGGGPSVEVRPIMLALDLIVGTFGAVAIRTWMIKRGRRRALDRGQCVHCGYDLRGSHSPRCPECGTPLPPHDLLESDA